MWAKRVLGRLREQGKASTRVETAEMGKGGVKDEGKG